MSQFQPSPATWVRTVPPPPGPANGPLKSSLVSPVLVVSPVLATVTVYVPGWSAVNVAVLIGDVDDEVDGRDDVHLDLVEVVVERLVRDGFCR